MNCNCEDIYPQSDMTRWESCPSSIIADANNYYTKHQVDELIESASTCCITPEEVDEKISAATDGMATEQWVEDQGYLKETDLSAYAKSSAVTQEISSAVSGKADTSYVNDELAKKLDASAYTPTDLSNYYTKSETSGKTEIANALSNKQDKLIAGANITISGNVISAAGGSEPIDAYTKQESDARYQPKGDYLTSGDTYLKGEIDDKLARKLDASAYTPTDLSNYYTKSETSGKTEIANALSNKQNTLTAGSGISIVNNVISATGGGGGIVDPTLSSGSSNPVANSAITEALNDKLDSSGYTQPIQSDWNQTNNGRLDYIKNKPTIPEVPTEISSFHNDVGYITTASTIFNNYATTANTYTKQEVDNKFWCGTEQEYQNLPTKQNNILYLIHD